MKHKLIPLMDHIHNTFWQERKNPAFICEKCLKYFDINGRVVKKDRVTLEGEILPIYDKEMVIFA